MQLWYGEADALVPLAIGRYLAQTLPHGELHICAGEGHLRYVPRWAELLSTLAGGGRQKEAG